VALTFEFAGELIEWRGPAPFYYVAIPAEVRAEIKEAAKVLSYGWGVVPARATIGATDYATSLFPKSGAYLLPVKNAVRLPEKLVLGQLVEVALTIGS
jgi:hypothetical protein